MRMRENDYDREKDNFARYKNIRSILKYGVMGEENRPLLSVVIPTYRRMEHLKEAIESVVSQDANGVSYELLVVDNEWFEFKGSQKETMLKEFDEKTVRYYQNEENIGMFGNWNRCVELARGEWVAMLHDDDYLLADYFLKVKKILGRIGKKKDAAMIKARCGALEKGVQRKREKAFRRWVEKTGVNKVIRYRPIDLAILDPSCEGILGAPTCGTLFNKKIFLKHGGYDPSHYPSADAYYPARLVNQYGYRVYRSVAMLGCYRFEVNESYKGETILGWAEEFTVYLQNYAKRNRYCKCMYRLFGKEIKKNEFDTLHRYLLESDFLTDKENWVERLEQIMEKPATRPVHYKLYRLLKIVHCKWKAAAGVLF